MDLKTTISNLTRVRKLYDRKESLQAFKLLVLTLESIANTSPPPVVVRSLLRECLQILIKDELFTKCCPRAIIYQPGQEQAIYTKLNSLYKEVEEAQTIEFFEKTRRRKLSMDLHLNEGLKELAKDNAIRADACFMNSVSFVHDEIRLYALIGKALLEAKEVRRAIAYLRKGHELAPNDAMMKTLLDEALAQKKLGERTVFL